MDYYKLTESENIYNKVNDDTLSVGTETASPFQDGGWFWGSSKKSQKNERAMLRALSNGKNECVKFMIEEDLVEDFGVEDHNQNTILHLLCIKGDEFSQLINQLIDNSKISGSLLEKKNKNGDTPVHLLCKNSSDPSQLCERFFQMGYNGKITNNAGEAVVETTVDNTESAMTDGESLLSLNDLNTTDFNTKPNSDVMGQEEFSKLVNESLKQTPPPRPPPPQLNSESPKSELHGGFNTEADTIEVVFNSENNPTKQSGGRRLAKEYGKRKSTSYASDSSANSDDELERMIRTQADEIHKRATEKIMNLLDVDEKTANVYKNAIYRKVKKEMSDLSYLDRAYETEKRITKEALKKIDINKAMTESEEIQKLIQEKKKAKKSKKSKKSKKPKKSKKETTEETESVNSDSAETTELSSEEKPKKKASKTKKDTKKTKKNKKDLESSINIDGLFPLSSTSYSY